MPQPEEVATLVTAGGAPRRPVRDPYAQRGSRAVRVDRRGAGGDPVRGCAGVPDARLQVSHLKCGAQAVWGRAAEAVERLEAARAEGLDVAADQYPYTAAATTLATILPPALLALGVDGCVAALGDRDARARIRSRSSAGSRAGRTSPPIPAGPAS